MKRVLDVIVDQECQLNLRTYSQTSTAAILMWWYDKYTRQKLIVGSKIFKFHGFGDIHENHKNSFPYNKFLCSN